MNLILSQLFSGVQVIIITSMFIKFDDNVHPSLFRIEYETAEIKERAPTTNCTVDNLHYDGVCMFCKIVNGGKQTNTTSCCTPAATSSDTLLLQHSNIQFLVNKNF